jgi:hypothetical protein
MPLRNVCLCIDVDLGESEARWYAILGCEVGKDGSDCLARRTPVTDGNVSLIALVGCVGGLICYHVAQKSTRTNVLADVRPSSSSALFIVVYPAIITQVSWLDAMEEGDIPFTAGNC